MNQERTAELEVRAGRRNEIARIIAQLTLESNRLLAEQVQIINEDAYERNQ